MPIVCRTCSTAWGCKSPAQPGGGEGLEKRKGVVARRGLKEAVDQRREPMNKNRVMRPTVWGELANDSEARFHQARWWEIRRLRVDGGRTYFGRPPACHRSVTEDGAIHSGRGAGGS